MEVEKRQDSLLYIISNLHVKEDDKVENLPLKLARSVFPSDQNLFRTPNITVSRNNNNYMISLTTYESTRFFACGQFKLVSSKKIVHKNRKQNY